MRKNWANIFINTARKFRNKTAVVHKNREISFEELESYAKVLSNFICQASDLQNKPILVLLPKSIELVYADLAVLFSHNIFSNLDVKLPAERLNNIISNIQPIGIISTAEYTDKLVLDQKVFVIDINKVNWSTSIDENPINHRISRQIDTDPFCIINTSGSTGTPKGVVLNHKSFFDFYDWSIETFAFTDEERIGSLSPAVFDIYQYELTLMMGMGATIVMLDETKASFPAELLTNLKESKATFLFWVPTIMVNIANMDLLSRIDLPDLKIIWFAGEVFPTKKFNYWKEHLPEVTFANLYGPIEITLDCIYYVVDKEIDDNEAIPIGIPCNNTDILLLNENDELCDAGEEGEICVRGTSLAMGYYNDPEKTATVFTQNPLNNSYPELIYRTGDIAYIDKRDGLYHFKGRKDSLIKHMGYRIELGEIEHVLVNGLKLVKNACVVYDYNAKQIVVFFEKKDRKVTEIRKELLKVFPKYMIPTNWNEEEELLRNTNGKINRLAYNKIINKKGEN